jgi:hypothetical protein
MCHRNVPTLLIEDGGAFLTARIGHLIKNGTDHFCAFSRSGWDGLTQHLIKMVLITIEAVAKEVKPHGVLAACKIELSTGYFYEADQ